MKLTKRPVPLSANGIGVWATIIDVVTSISIFTNMGVFAFTMSTFKDLDNQDIRFYVFIGLAILFMAIRYIIGYAIPDISENMRLLKRRHSYLIEKSLKGFIKSKPRSILPEKSNFAVSFTTRDNQHDMSKVASLFYIQGNESPEKPTGAFNQSQASERSGLLAGILHSDAAPARSEASMPTIGEEQAPAYLPAGVARLTQPDDLAED